MNLRQVRKKIKSIGNVKKITKAMQMVSAVKMRKAQQLALEGRAYSDSLNDIITKVVPSVDEQNSLLLKQPQNTEKELVILVSSSKGLCGSFNVNLFRLLIKRENYKKTEFIVMGKKGSVFLSRTGGNILADFSSGPPLIEVSAVFDLVVKEFVSQKYKKVSIIYNKFISTLNSEAIEEVILPLARSESESGKLPTKDYKIEPSPEELIEQLLLSYVEEKIRTAVINSEASEHSSRMIAMKNATDNANDVIYSLTLVGNKLRQEKITYELLDMITAKESVEVS